ncbi:MAG: IS110 family transposase [Acidimicrobiia bacterium]
MDTMTELEVGVILGVDTHHRFHVAAVLDTNGGVLSTATFEASHRGYRRLLAWAAGFGRVEKVGVEGTGAWGKGLARFLTGEEVRVVEVIRPNRQRRRRYGKSDVTDAISAGRAVISGEASGVPRGDGALEALRVLRVARRSAVGHRTRIINQIRSIIVTCPDDLRERLDQLTTDQLIGTCGRFRPGADIADPAVAARHALKTLARQHQQLGTDVDLLTAQMGTIVAGHAPQGMLEMVGVGPIVAADILIAWGSNPDRVTSEAAFAALTGVSAVEASSGEHVRHRLNRGGDRQANAALYRMVIVRLRYHPETRVYMQRRLAEGKTKKEIIRCLKRYAARDLYQHLQHAT